MIRRAISPFNLDLWSPMRNFAVALLLLGCFVRPLSAAGAPDAVSIKSTCELLSPTYDTHEVSCIIAGSSKVRRLQFKAMFSGGHDDTLVSIHPSINDSEIACEDGSKTSAFAEDGDITLKCNLTMNSAEGNNTKAKIIIRWSHAQFADFDVLTSRAVPLR